MLIQTDDNLTELVTKAQEGDNESFEIIFRQFRPRIRAFIYRLGYKGNNVDDLVQEAFLKAYINLEKLENPEYFSTWLHRIAKNEYLQGLRKNSRGEDESLDSLFLSDRVFTPEELYIGRQFELRIADAMSGLPEKFRNAVEGSISGNSIDEDAIRLNVLGSTIKTQRHRGHVIFVSRLKELYPEMEYHFMRN